MLTPDKENPACGDSSLLEGNSSPYFILQGLIHPKSLLKMHSHSSGAAHPGAPGGTRPSQRRAPRRAPCRCATGTHSGRAPNARRPPASSSIARPRFSRDMFPILSRDPSFQETIKDSGETAGLLKRTMVEKNGESTPRVFSRHEESCNSELPSMQLQTRCP